METVTCPNCGQECQPSKEPVTISGWYGEVRYIWMENPHRPVIVGCVHCLTR